MKPRDKHLISDVDGENALEILCVDARSKHRLSRWLIYLDLSRILIPGVNVVFFDSACVYVCVCAADSKDK